MKIEDFEEVVLSLNLPNEQLVPILNKFGIKKDIWDLYYINNHEMLKMGQHLYDLIEQMNHTNTLFATLDVNDLKSILTKSGYHVDYHEICGINDIKVYFPNTIFVTLELYESNFPSQNGEVYLKVDTSGNWKAEF